MADPICRVLPIAPSTYRAHAARRADPDKTSARDKRDALLRPEIHRVWDDNFRVYGVRKGWRQLVREGFDVARCTVARLMKQMGIEGIIRGKKVRTTIPDKAAPCPIDRVNRQFRTPTPNMLWDRPLWRHWFEPNGRRLHIRLDLGRLRLRCLRHRRLRARSARPRTGGGSRLTVGWRASRSARADFVLDALEQALHERRPLNRGGLVHHSDRGGQYRSIRYTERLAEAGIEPSVGSVGDGYDNLWTPPAAVRS